MKPLRILPFYNLISAIVNVIKYNKKTDPIYTASKILTLSTALFSMFSLQNAMLNVFGNANMQRNMNIITGMIVFLLLLFMSIYMIWKGSKIIRREAKQSE